MRTLGTAPIRHQLFERALRGGKVHYCVRACSKSLPPQPLGGSAREVAPIDVVPQGEVLDSHPPQGALFAEAWREEGST